MYCTPARIQNGCIAHDAVQHRPGGTPASMYQRVVRVNPAGVRCVAAVAGVVATWSVALSGILYLLLGPSTSVSAPVDVAVGPGIGCGHGYGYELFALGTDTIRCGTTYRLWVHLTFVNSWSTASSGPLTLMAELAGGRQAVSTIIPYEGTMGTWLVGYVTYVPAYALGLIPETFVRTVLMDRAFRCIGEGTSLETWVVETTLGAPGVRGSYAARIRLVPADRGDAKMSDLVHASVTVEEQRTWGVRRVLAVATVVGTAVAATILVAT